MQNRYLLTLVASLAGAALLVTGCSRGETADGGDESAFAPPPPIAHPAPASGAAASGVATSPSYRMSFSLGGAISPMKSASYQSNRGGAR